VSKKQRVPFIALTTLLRRRFPDVDDPDDLIHRGLVVVNGASVSNSRAHVPANASIRLLRITPLRGTVKLAYALQGRPWPRPDGRSSAKWHRPSPGRTVPSKRLSMPAAGLPKNHGAPAPPRWFLVPMEILRSDGYQWVA
jgi:hypothetical protein